ncbi:hypothetical protein SPRA44_340062 [Serratia proteamaculans]|uniref:hypothetical protein n=1 Tax=Serratia proteamaculans TaxID=28151 RepID=UPI0009F7E977|nr:hypothetical protein [Serratia proteamaculans]SMB36279.1 hypothetical protein SPRA44_340062 [Serratia proteamaculans]
MKVSILLTLYPLLKPARYAIPIITAVTGIYLNGAEQQQAQIFGGGVSSNPLLSLVLAIIETGRINKTFHLLNYIYNGNYRHVTKFYNH